MESININRDQIVSEYYPHSCIISNKSTIHNAKPVSKTVDSFSGPRLFSITAEIGNPITKCRAAGMITPCFGDGQSELKLLQLMSTLNESGTGPEGQTMK